MDQRKYCETCGKALIAFGNDTDKCYLHPDGLCNGVRDMIDIDTEITDEFLYKKFIELYGTPKLTDYERVTQLEQHKKVLIEQVKQLNENIEHKDKFLKHWLIKFFLRFLE